MDEKKQNILQLLTDEPFFLSNITEKSLELYLTALTHKSYSDEENKKGHNYENNERLEFLGNYVLDFIIAEYLYENFPKFDPGNLNEAIKITANVNLAKVITKNNIKIGNNTMRLRNDTSPNDKIVADALEALLGAIYLDKKIDVTREIIQRIFKDEIMKIYKKHHT